MKYIKLFEQFKSHQEIDDICNKYGIENYTINDDLSIDVEGDVDLNDKDLKEFPLNFKNVTGNFNCRTNILTSLKGAPSSVGGYFRCQANNLTTLEGSPRKVGKSFYCSYNNLTSLLGVPDEIGGDFYFNNNYLISLDFLPSFVGGEFNLSYNKITSLKGVPNSIATEFNFYGNPIYSFEYFPDFVGGQIYMPVVLRDILNLFDNKAELIDLFNDYNIIKDPKNPGDKPRLKVSNLNKFLSENGFKELEDTSRLEKYYELK